MVDVWRRIKSISWYESSNPGKFVVEILYDPSGVRGAILRGWLRSWLPWLVELARGILIGKVPEEEVARYAEEIREAKEEIKSE